MTAMDDDERLRANIEEQARRIRTVEDAVQYVLANLPENAPLP